MRVIISYDREGDFLEVLLSDKPGYMRETDNEAVMARVSEDGRLLGFSVLNISAAAKEKPLIADLLTAKKKKGFKQLPGLE